jgi:hypothetical protein
VEANCVYVIPPDKHLLMADGHLTLTDLPHESGEPSAVDTFFRTLAETHRSGCSLSSSNRRSQQLAVAIGLSAEEVKKELLVVGQFPRPHERSLLKAEDILPLVDLAARERGDLMAARKTEEANELLLLGAKNNTLPQPNAAFGAGLGNLAFAEVEGDRCQASRADVSR